MPKRTTIISNESGWNAFRPQIQMPHIDATILPPEFGELDGVEILGVKVVADGEIKNIEILYEE